MCYPVCGMVHINELLLLLEKSSLCSGGSWFLSEWSFTICPTSYNRLKTVLNASLNKTFLPSLVLCKKDQTKLDLFIVQINTFFLYSKTVHIL